MRQRTRAADNFAASCGREWEPLEFSAIVSYGEQDWRQRHIKRRKAASAEAEAFEVFA